MALEFIEPKEQGYSTKQGLRYLGRCMFKCSTSICLQTGLKLNRAIFYFFTIQFVALCLRLPYYE